MTERKIKERHAPFRLLVAVLYSPISIEWLEDLGNSTVRIDRAPLARHLKTSTERLKENLAWLEHCQYIEVLGSEKGRSTIRIRKPERVIQGEASK